MGDESVRRAKPGTSKEAAENRRIEFVEAFVANGGNAKQAAITAGYSPRSAAQQGARMLKDANVSTAIDQRRGQLLKKTQLSTEEIMADIARTLRFDPRNLYNDDGSMKSIKDLDDATAACLTGIEVVIMKGTENDETPLYVKKVKWEGKSTAREQAMRVFGMFEKDNKQKVSDLEGLPRELLQAMVQRLKALNDQR